MNSCILSIDHDASIEHPDNLIVFNGKCNLKNIYEWQGKYYIETLIGRPYLSPFAEQQYLAYLKWTEEIYEEDAKSQLFYFFLACKKNGLVVPMKFTGREVLSFDMEIEI